MALATLSIDLVARLAQFQQGLDQAGRLAQARANTIAAAFDGIRGAGLAIGGSLAAAFATGGAITAFVQRLNAPLLAMKDLSEATGAAFENVSALENIARNAGATFDVVGGALVRFNQSLAAAENATAPISVALQRIGLDAQELRRQDPAIALQAVAQALARFADDGEKARLVQELFGRSVREVAPFLRDLAEAGKLNAGVTAEQAEEADKLDKNIARLKSNFEDLGRTILASTVPALNSLTDAVRANGVIGGLVALNELIGRVLGTDPGSILQQRIEGVADEIAGLQARLAGPGSLSSQLRAALEGQLNEKLIELQRLQAQAQAAVRRAGGSLAGLPQAGFSNEGRSRAVGRLLGPQLPPLPPSPPPPPSAPLEQRLPITPEQATLVEALRRLEQTDDARLQSLRSQLEALVRLVQQGGTVEDSVFAGLADEIARIDPAGRAAAERIARINALLGETPTARMERATGDIKLLIDAASEADTPEAFRRLNEALRQSFDRLGELPELIEPAAASISTFAEQAGRNIQDALGDTLEQALSGNFRNIGQLWVQTLQRMAAQAAAARLNELIFSTLGGSSNPFLAAIGNLFKGGRADGGAVDAGGTYLVGERGPEVVSFGRSGYVTSAERLRMGGAAGGGGLTYSPTIVVQGDVGPATVSLIERALARERARSMRMTYAQGAA